MTASSDDRINPATNVYGMGDDEILYRSAGSTQTFYKTDPMGNVKFLFSSAGTGVEKYTYDAFGQPTITDWNGNLRTTSVLANRFMFSGREYFSSLGLYDLRNRIYDPQMGRFHQTDPIGFDGDPSNLYRFSGNNPLLGGDPSGLDGFLGIDWGGAWNSFTATVSAVSNWLNDNNINIGSGGGSPASPTAESDPFDLNNGYFSAEPFGGYYSWTYIATAGTFAGGSNAGLIGSDYAGRTASSGSVPQPVFRNVGAENPIVRDTLARLMQSPVMVGVMEKVAEKGGANLEFISNPYRTLTDSSTNTIYWDPHGYAVTPNGVISPHLLLGHELVHAMINATIPKWQAVWWRIRPAPWGYMWEYDNYMEWYVITKFEQPAAQQLAQPKRFSSWRGYFIRR